MQAARQRLIDLLRAVFWRTTKDAAASELQLPPQHQRLSRLRFSAVEAFYYRRQHDECKEAVASIVQRVAPSLDAATAAPAQASTAPTAAAAAATEPASSASQTASIAAARLMPPPVCLKQRSQSRLRQSLLPQRPLSSKRDSGVRRNDLRPLWVTMHPRPSCSAARCCACVRHAVIHRYAKFIRSELRTTLNFWFARWVVPHSACGVCGARKRSTSSTSNSSTDRLHCRETR